MKILSEADRKSRSVMLASMIDGHMANAFPDDVWSGFPHFTQNLIIVIQTAKIFDEIFADPYALHAYAHEQFCNVMLKPLVRRAVLTRQSTSAGWMASVSPLALPYNENGVS